MLTVRTLAIASSLVLLLLHFVDLDDEVPARSLEKGGFDCRSAPAEREALDLYPQERGALKNPGEPSVDPPLIFHSCR